MKQLSMGQSKLMLSMSIDWRMQSMQALWRQGSMNGIRLTWVSNGRPQETQLNGSWSSH